MKFNDWTDAIQRIRDHARDGHPLHSVVEIKASEVMPGVHLSVNAPGLSDQPICDSFDHYTTATWAEPADCVVCLALARAAHGVDISEPAPPPLGRDVWKLKAFNHRRQQWETRHVGGEEKFSLMLSEMLRWRAEGQQVRLEWSELN